MAGAPERVRADVLLVARGLLPSRAQARAAIEAGLVRAGGVPVGRPSDLLPAAIEIEAGRPHPWVSRGGVKLAAALDAWAIDPAGLLCLDVGASTGGFTDVLLARGAAAVEAVDVGHGQLHPRLAADPRVRSREGTDARRLAGLLAAGSVDLAAVDVSFIPLRLVLPGLVPLLRPGGRLVLLAKPQFEVGRAGLGRGGVVRDDGLREESVAAVIGLLAPLGLDLLGRLDSPIAGGDGNREVLVGARRRDG